MKSFKLSFIVILFGFIAMVSCKQNSQDKINKEEPSAASYEESQENSSESNKGQAFIKNESEKPNCLQVAMSSEDHTTLVKAVQAAGVENALVNVGPLTVFAPTNEAFDQLPEETLKDLMKPENKSQLAYVLTNHVAPSNYPIETLKKLAEQKKKLYMASGNYVDVTTDGKDVFVDGKKIWATIDADNGWVHVISEVMVPAK